MGTETTMMKIALCCVVLASVFASATAVHVKGSMELDAWTFDKVIGGDRPVLVKFDQDHAYGDKEDAFKEVCKRLGESGADILVGVVGVQEYGDKLNEDMAERFQVKKDDFPVYKLFLKGSSTPIDFKGEVNADELTRFVKTEAAVYIALPGCLQEFDAMARTFATDPSSRAATKLAAESAAQALTKENDAASGKYYALVMKKILEKGDGFVDSELTRLKKVMAGSIAPEKKALFEKRLNILPSFKVDGKKEL